MLGRRKGAFPVKGKLHSKVLRVEVDINRMEIAVDPHKRCDRAFTFVRVCFLLVHGTLYLGLRRC